MSPERQAIIKAINQGHCTPKAIGEYVGKPPQTISKLLYVMCNQGLLQKARYGIYRIVESSTIHRDTIEHSITQALLFKVEALENRLSNIESGQGSSEPAIEPSIDSAIESTLFKLQTENEALQNKNANLESKLEKLQTENEALQNKNADLESKLEAVQSEAQTNIDALAQKLSEAKREIQRQSTEYNNLHKKYMALKTDIFDGNAPVKSTTRNPLTLNGEAEAEYIIDTDKAKERVIELTKQGLDHKAITQQLEAEGYRTKNFLGDVKPYLQTNIGKWQRKFKQKGSI